MTKGTRDAGYYFELANNVINLAINHDKQRTGNCESYAYYRGNGEVFSFFLFPSDKYKDQVEKAKNIANLATLITADILKLTESSLNDIEIRCVFHKGTYQFFVERVKSRFDNSFLFSSVVVH